MDVLRSHTGEAIQRFMIAGSSYYPLGWKAKGRKWCYWNLEDRSICHVGAWREGPWSHRKATAAAREATGSRARGEQMPWLLPSFCPRIFCQGLSLAKPPWKPEGKRAPELWCPVWAWSKLVFDQCKDQAFHRPAAMAKPGDRGLFKPHEAEFSPSNRLQVSSVYLGLPKNGLQPVGVLDFPPTHTNATFVTKVTGPKSWCVVASLIVPQASSFCFLWTWRK